MLLEGSQHRSRCWTKDTAAQMFHHLGSDSQGNISSSRVLDVPGSPKDKEAGRWGGRLAPVSPDSRTETL